MTATPQKRDGQATRERILESAKQLLAEGDGHFEMSWIAKGAGVSQGLAYHHFGSKEGLLLAVVNDFYDRVENAVLMARLDDIENWDERERERVHRYIEFLIKDPLAVTVITRLTGTPAVARVEAERWEKLIVTGAKNMADGQARGAVASPCEPRLLAAMTLGAVRSAVASEFSNKRPVDATQLAHTIWSFVRSGLDFQDTV